MNAALTITVPGQGAVSALADAPPDARCALTVAHGAGAGMRHRFFETLVPALNARGVATLRFQFPYVEAGRRRPDRPDVAIATVRAAVDATQSAFPGLPLFAGGKSFGGRMTSHAQAESPLAGVRGLVFLGFPLHRPKAPSVSRAEHLSRIDVPMLFVQGSRDAMADLALLGPTLEALGSGASLHVVDRADHGFGVPKSTGRSAEDVLEEVAEVVMRWAADASGA